MIKSDFHIHSNFCDGKSTPRDIVLSAIEKGFTAIGFSSHSYFYMDKSFALGFGRVPLYIETVKALKEEFKGKIKIFCGIEQDFFSNEPTDSYDYVIGSVHYVEKNGVYYPVDESAKTEEETLLNVYGGDFDAYAADYFSLVSRVVEKTNCDIIGHFDLVSKFSDINKRTQSEEYLASAEKAVRALIPCGKPFEINTGAMSRGYRKTPYPSLEILSMIKSYGGDIIFSGDSHNCDYIGYKFDEAERLAKEIGFTRAAVITENGMDYIGI